jgi:hypothetical protein
MNELDILKKEIATLKRNSQNNTSKPHKLLMLLAVLDLAEEGLLSENRIYFDARLIERFEKYFHFGANGADLPQATQPFFHLRSSNFWHHKLKTGRDAQYAALTTSGGGSKRIHDNIEYAFLSEGVFEFISDSRTRQNLREFIMSLFPPVQSEQLKTTMQPSNTKLGTAFHETFPLDRSRLAPILETVTAHSNEEARLTYEDFKERSGLGANQVKSFRRYAYGTGLIDENERLTNFGALVTEQDPQLATLATQWVMNYHMTAPHHSGPLFWHHLLKTALIPGNELTREGTGQLIKDFLTQQGDRALADDTYPKTATVFLGSYEKGGGFESLEILRTEAGKYRVGQPRPIPVGAFACVLVDYWAAKWGTAREVLLSDLTGGELAELLLLSSGEVNSLLREVSKRGLVNLQRRTPPFQVIRLWDSPQQVWQSQLFAEATR